VKRAFIGGANYDSYREVTSQHLHGSTPAWITTVTADSHRNTPAGEDNKESMAHISTRYCK